MPSWVPLKADCAPSAFWNYANGASNLPASMIFSRQAKSISSQCYSSSVMFDGGPMLEALWLRHALPAEEVVWVIN